MSCPTRSSGCSDGGPAGPITGRVATADPGSSAPAAPSPRSTLAVAAVPVASGTADAATKHRRHKAKRTPATTVATARGRQARHRPLPRARRTLAPVATPPCTR